MMTSIKDPSRHNANPHAFIAVGGFRGVGADQSTGGQQTACTTLFATPLATRHRWIYVDTTASGDEATHALSRVGRGLSRAGRLARHGTKRGVTGALIFTSAHLSFVEKGLLAVAMKRTGKRVVLCPRSGLLLDDWAKSAAFRRFMPWVLRHCDAVVCQGESWRQRFLDMGARADTLAVIPNWIDPKANPALPKKEPRNNPLVRFLFIGRLESYKGVWDLIDAISERRHDLAHCVFELAGGGSCEDALRARIAQTGLQNQVQLLGWIGGQRKRDALANADCLVVPSHREGMPNVVLEAMAAERAVIATSVGGTPDIIGTTDLGVLVPARNPQALGTALVDLAKDPVRRKRLGQAGRDHVLQNHDVDVAWRKFETLLIGTASATTRSTHSE